MRWLVIVALLLPVLPAAAEDGEGQRIFTRAAEPACAVCHMLEAAGAAGEIGPSLDALKPSEERVRKAVTGGVGAMPAYGGQLSEAQIEAVARYVAEAAGG